MSSSRSVLLTTNAQDTAIIFDNASQLKFCTGVQVGVGAAVQGKDINTKYTWARMNGFEKLIRIILSSVFSFVDSPTEKCMNVSLKVLNISARKIRDDYISASLSTDPKDANLLRTACDNLTTKKNALVSKIRPASSANIAFNALVIAIFELVAVQPSNDDRLKALEKAEKDLKENEGKLNKEVADLKKQLEQAKKQPAPSKPAPAASNNTDAATIQEALNEAMKNVTQLSAENEQLQAQVASLQFGGSSDDAAKMLSEAFAQNELLQAKIKKLEANANQPQPLAPIAIPTDIQENLDKVKKENALLKEDIGEFLKQPNLDPALKGAYERIIQLNDVLEEQHKKKAEFQIQLTKMQDYAKTIELQLGQVKTENDALKKANAGLKNNDAQKEVEKLRKDIERLRAAPAPVKKDDAEMAKLRSDYDRLTQDHKRLNDDYSKLKEQDAMLMKIGKTVHALKQQNDQLKAEIAKLKGPQAAPDATPAAVPATPDDQPGAS